MMKFRDILKWSFLGNIYQILVVVYRIVAIKRKTTYMTKSQQQIRFVYVFFLLRLLYTYNVYFTVLLSKFIHI